MMVASFNLNIAHDLTISSKNWQEVFANYKQYWSGTNSGQKTEN
jgi:hypothetical protein